MDEWQWIYQTTMRFLVKYEFHESELFGVFLSIICLICSNGHVLGVDALWTSIAHLRTYPGQSEYAGCFQICKMS